MQLQNYLSKVPVLMGVLSVLLSCTSFPSYLDADIIPVGQGAYTTDQPANTALPSGSLKVTSDFKQFPNTNDWWTSLIWNYNSGNAYSENLFAHPLSLKAGATGLEVGYPTSLALTPYFSIGRRNVQEYHYGHAKDLTLGVAGLNAPNTLVKSYSDWAVTAEWANNGQKMNATFGKGLPFVYVTQTGGDAIVSIASLPTVWQNANGVVGITVNGHHYGVFGPAGSSWTINGSNLQSSLNGAGYYSIAILPDNQSATLEFYRRHAYAFVTDTKVSWDYNETTATLTATYAVSTTLREAGPNNSNVNQPLMALYRHQWLNSPTAMTPYIYTSPRGTMKVVDGKQFITNAKFQGILPFLPNYAKDDVGTYSASQLYDYVDTIYKQGEEARWNGTGPETDTYWTGKALGKIAKLIPIADQVKHTAARDLFISETKQRLQNWYDGKTSNTFYYNELWKTLIGYPASYGSDNQLNDHHFHYGYYIMASAIIANYDPAWAAQNAWGGMVNLVLRDPGSWNREDSLFPFLRNFDIYEGHSWASGPAAFAAGNNEESSSEDFNFMTGMFLWGVMTNNKAIRDMAIYLYTTNIEAVTQYWFDIDNAVFPNGFVPPTLGMIWGDGGAYTIWWDGSTQEVHGINFLPIQPGMLYLGRYPEYLKINQAFMLQNNGADSTGTWRDIHMSVKALYDSAGAITELNANSNYTEEPGESRAHTYHWIHNINQLGAIDPTVTANIPTYQVFLKNGKHTHVAYNPSTNPVTAKFSDGVSFTVAAKGMATEEGSVSPPPPPSDNYTETTDDKGQVIISFKPNIAIQSVKLYYKINNSGAFKAITMVNESGTWQATISNLENGNTINYYYAYIVGDKTINSKESVHVYKCPGCDSSPPPPPPPSGLIDETTEYTLSAQATGDGLTLTFKPKQTSELIDVHYKINGGGQLNYRMKNASGNWTFVISGLKNGDKIEMSFTYTISGVGHDSKVYTYTYSS